MRVLLLVAAVFAVLPAGSAMATTSARSTPVRAVSAGGEHS
jgi:hypothetical protein